ncbi:MAG: nucleoside triphosphate pyrophosphohydrolase [Muribaculaceae bacterium]|nr:nucleoside triphosphate pyrophosphohydrolase [Muribaculaceae bacterium]
MKSKNNAIKRDKAELAQSLASESILSNSREQKLEAFGALLDVIDNLREKCPWDSVQTNESMRPNTIEEAMELAEALLGDDNATIKKELGDVLLHVLLYSRIGEETGAYDIAEVCNSLRQKLIYRHPHIYGNDKVSGVKELLEHWEVIKMKEKDGNKTILGGVPSTLPSLIKAERVQEKAANVGFDWEKKEDVWDKVKEELAEVETEMKAGNEANIEKEFGDLFFALVNAARLYGVRPDNALEKTNLKFIARFNHVEKRAKEQGKRLNEMTLAEMDKLWDEAKQLKLGE